MRIIALKAWSNGSYSMEEKQIAELPDALATQLIASGIVAPTALPAITDADDGKVLTADSGVWVAQTPASGGGVMLVSVSAVQDGNDTIYTADKTAREIINAMPLAYTEERINAGTVITYAFVLFSDGAYSIEDGTYTFSYQSMDLVAGTLDDYPTHTETGK